MSTKKTIQRKLSREERNRIESAIARAKRDSKVPATAQQTIPYLRMHPDGKDLPVAVRKALLEILLDSGLLPDLI